MKFRKRLFTFLAWLAFAWIVFGLFFYSGYYTEYTATANEFETAGAGIGSMIGYFMWFFCPGVFGVLLFAYVSHRNHRGMVEQQRHEELMEVQRR